LKEGDLVEMEIDNLGKLSNTIVLDEDDFSILENKRSGVGSPKSEVGSPKSE